MKEQTKVCSLKDTWFRTGGTLAPLLYQPHLMEYWLKWSERNLRREDSHQEQRQKCWKMGGEVHGVGWSNPTSFQDRDAVDKIASFASSRKGKGLCVIRKILDMKENVTDALQEHTPTLERQARLATPG